MRRIVIGIVIGCVVGVMFGATVIAPRLDQSRAVSTHTPDSPAMADKKKPTDTSDQKNRADDTAPKPVPPEQISGTVLPPAGPDRPVVRWRMASAWSGSLPQLGSLGLRVGRKLWEVTDGGIEIKFFEPGELVPTSEMFNAVSSGSIDAAFSSPGYWGEKIPALQLFSAVPFGPEASEYMAWMYFGGGRDLMQDIYDKHGIHSVLCGMNAPEASGWFRRAFTTVDDLKGLKMRATGLGAQVLRKVGVHTFPLQEGDIFTAFEMGDIDAAEFSMPAIDLKMGFYEMASHYYFPGWHQPTTFFDLMINKGKWDALPKIRRSQIETVCGDNVRQGLAEGEALQFTALKDLTARGVKIHRWPEAILTSLENAWRDVAAEQSSADSDFRRVFASLTAFRKNYAVWHELSRR